MTAVKKHGQLRSLPTELNDNCVGGISNFEDTSAIERVQRNWEVLAPKSRSTAPIWHRFVRVTD